ncbi:S1 RNA binding family protein [Tumebacillus sp. BK434]|uniref:S1 RNA-binding domain-containing protein n=1 Tax=Tumebacillus sp. BK434 TaxID=2512169 RepID=UPI001043A742|nr:S1 RNA-binding domain-containing protein [Tumebacillus sp. BK434]TCP55435.1 S1 RNA binding family protein [Tumebacillus sp. BK434]
MDTLRYVQQFGRSKKDNLKPSLLSKYHVGSIIEVYPFRIMDFGCFASTSDGLSGLIHNSEMSSVMQNNLQEMIDKQVPITVRINKFDRRTGEIAFSLENKEKTSVHIESALQHETSAIEERPATSDAPETVVASAEPETEVEGELQPHQFKINQPVHPEPAPQKSIASDLSARLDQETADIQKFLEGVLKQELSPVARKMLRDLLQNTSTFRFTYAMQTAVDAFEPDVGVQLMTSIERTLREKA